MPISDLLAQISGDAPVATVPYSPPPQKRKAESTLQRSDDKVIKRESLSTNGQRPAVLSARSIATPVSRIKPGTNTSSFAPKPGGPSNGTSPTPNASAIASSKPPKKGSFAEIMARGKVAQASMGQVGKITHKSIEKPPSKREREDIKTQKSGNRGVKGNPRSRSNTPLRDGKNGLRENNGKATTKQSSEKVPERKVKKAATATTGYTGTARPVPSKATKSSRPAYRNGAAADRDRYEQANSYSRYRYADEEEAEDDDDIEEEEDYESDLSDMEAATFEVDEEEERAARIARREDADAKREEDRAREMKRKRLAALAKQRR